MKGERKKVGKGEGDVVLEGKINGEGILRVKVKEEDKENKIERVVSMVEEEKEEKEKKESLINSL